MELIKKKKPKQTISTQHAVESLETVFRAEIKRIVSLWKLKGHVLWVKLFLCFPLNKLNKVVSLMLNYGTAMESAAPKTKQAGK